MEQSVPSKHNFVVTILHEEANAVLGVTRSVERLDRNAADVEGLAVLWCLGHLLAVLPANDLEGLSEL